ncbi:MAG: hypothetical protein QM718_12495 [Steroidobacteraceae bacterium]
MRSWIGLRFCLCGLCLVWRGFSLAEEPAARPESDSAARGAVNVTAISAHFQAGSGIYRQREGGGVTWHYGKGYIEPFGAAEYYCGKGFPEEKQYPPPSWVIGMFGKMTGIPDPLFCIYTVDAGSFYVYDGASGNRVAASDGGLNQIVNVVFGGTGKFKGATGLWLGTAEG